MGVVFLQLKAGLLSQGAEQLQKSCQQFHLRAIHEPQGWERPPPNCLKAEEEQDEMVRVSRGWVLSGQKAVTEVLMRRYPVERLHQCGQSVLSLAFLGEETLLGSLALLCGL